MAHFEVEIKSLLGAEANASALKHAMQMQDPACTQTSRNTQLNHYFHSGDIHKLYALGTGLFSGDDQAQLQSVIERGTDFSVRTRQKDDEVLLVVKAAVDEGTSENTVQRMEFEESVALSLAELDALVQQAGYEYQAKWSRAREEYSYKGITVCLDKNAGYGYLAEFEKIVPDEASVSAAHDELITLMAELGVVELPQAQLARMFDFYNIHWSEYYGTDKTFTIE